MPMRGELQISAAHLNYRRPVIDDVWSWLVATVTNPEFGVIALFCAVGLWLTFYFLHAFPNFGGMAVSLGQLHWPNLA